MEPLSARGLPRLSWIDTLYSSTYLSSITLLLSTHHFSFICALYLSVFCPAPPSSLSRPLPVRVTAPAICTQGTLCIFRTSNYCALLWLSITRHSTQGHHTHTSFSGNNSCPLPSGFLLASNHRSMGKPRDYIV